MIEINPIIKTNEIEQSVPELKKLTGEIDNKVFGVERDTRRQIRLRILKTDKLDENFTSFVVAETEAKKILAGYLFLLLIIYLISLVI